MLNRRPNAELRSREYLTETEVEQLCDAARARGRHGHRDATMILMAFRHGLRVSELISLRWTQINFVERTIHVNRVKRGKASRQQLSRREVDALQQLPSETHSHIFVGERGPLSGAAFARILRVSGESINFPLKVHPHMLRHACGYKLANDGRDTRAIQDYLGHRNIQHTVHYTELAQGRFNGFFED
jgi:type 1 fimbriae regulatory protein FimB/type 1 fimbriae regulatory protein FimE